MYIPERSLEPPEQEEPKTFECEHCRRDVDDLELVFYIDREYICRDCAIRKLGRSKFYDDLEDLEAERAGDLINELV